MGTKLLLRWQKCSKIRLNNSMNILKNIKLHTLNEWTVWDINYISIKLFLKKRSDLPWTKIHSVGLEEANSIHSVVARRWILSTTIELGKEPLSLYEPLVLSDSSVAALWDPEQKTKLNKSCPDFLPTETVR